MLHTLTDSGHMAWTCPCGDERMAHISHDAIQHTDATMIALPPCDCGKQTFLKVNFTDEELANVARFVAGDNSGIETTASIDAAHRHIALARQMSNIGKGPTQ
jgi:hypothetical protein